MKLSAFSPLRPRNMIGTALVLGILAGIWLGDLFQGFGLGPGNGGTAGPRSEGHEPGDKSHEPNVTGEASLALDSRPSTLDSDGPVHVLIDDRSYFIREGDARREVELSALVQLIERTVPNDDGLKAVVNRTPASRTSVEHRLFAALKEAGVPKSAVYMPEQAIE